MSLSVNWSTLESESLGNWTKDFLTDALNSGKRPNVLASDIEIKDLNFGKVGPTFEILEIGELDQDRFRGIFKINYEGDFHLTLHTKVQANPLRIYSSNSYEREVNHQEEHNSFVTPNFILADDPFALPLDLKLSDLKISGIGIIVFSKSKGLTLVFRNDPLDSIKVSSTFDTVLVLANFIQAQIEKQIRDLFRETLPTLIHELSLKYVSLSEASDFMEFQSRLKDKLNSLDHDGGEKISIKDIDSEFAYSSKNFMQNLKLFNSRETLALNVPRFKNTIQRSHLEKYNKTFPNLMTSLNSNLHLLDTATISPSIVHDNSIPIDMLVRDDVDIDRVLNEIANIQSSNYYYKLNNGNSFNATARAAPKRRVIKLRHGKARRSSNVSDNLSCSSDATLCAFNPELSKPHRKVSMTAEYGKPSSKDDFLDMAKDASLGTRSNADPVPLEQPKPMRYSQDIKDQNNLTYIEGPVQSHSHILQHFNSANSSPTHASSSLLSSVGIGNNYFNFMNNQAMPSSPVKEPSNELKEKKSLNYIDIEAIHRKLMEAGKVDNMKKPNFEARDKYSYYRSLMDLPPPPYQV